MATRFPVQLFQNIDPETREGRAQLLLSHLWNMQRDQTDGRDVCLDLIARGVDTEYLTDDWYQKTALMLAAEKGFPDIVDALLNAGANVNETDTDGKMALVHAISGRAAGAVDVVKRLLQAKPYLERYDSFNMTPLFHCIPCAEEIVPLLIEAGASVHAKNVVNMTPLVWAAGYPFTAPICDMLIKAGADIDHKDNHGQTARDRAAIQGNEKVVAFLDGVKGDRQHSAGVIRRGVPVAGPVLSKPTKIHTSQRRRRMD